MWCLFAVSKERYALEDCPDNLTGLSVHEFIPLADIIEPCETVDEGWAKAQPYVKDTGCAWLEDGTLAHHIKVTSYIQGTDPRKDFGA